jgi:hypothetical protein
MFAESCVVPWRQKKTYIFSVNLVRIDGKWAPARVISFDGIPIEAPHTEPLIGITEREDLEIAIKETDIGWPMVGCVGYEAGPILANALGQQAVEAAVGGVQTECGEFRKILPSGFWAKPGVVIWKPDGLIIDVALLSGPASLLIYILWSKQARVRPKGLVGGAGHCPRCGYDLGAGEISACPECGSIVKK